MKKSEEIEVQIWSYIDGSCSVHENAAIAAKIAEDQIWREKFNELQQLNNGLKDLGPEQPSPGFSMRVMNALNTEKTPQPVKRYFNKYIIRGLAAFFIGIIFIGLLQAAFYSSPRQTPDTIQVLKRPPIHYDSIFTGNTILVLAAVNITLALALADKILRKRVYF